MAVGVKWTCESKCYERGTTHKKLLYSIVFFNILETVPLKKTP